ncbi:MAG: diguanylate cyclase/phosphodiesterase (GGDEF & EAL domains) with PAS/PAC sensor(s) [Pseudolabrys sp.]|jgi:diguanylate cyclase (GGDEF)-like protein/PAS domain S-box-containing protein|nr:diguanylate cyclase/phosphodiesterase (GGDEF & EAL domains) with PAS/PAC sensor(s) [Pseudolabrys sp.]
MDQAVVRPIPAANTADVVTFPQTPAIGEELLKTVLDNMSLGVLLFDSETRLIFCNKRYLEMYGLPAEMVRPGRYLRDLLLLRAQTGTMSEDPDDYTARLRNGLATAASFTHTVQLDDGRAFTVVNKPVEGGGWLATHEDITERKRSDTRIAHMARHDALTDLPNRVLLHERLEHELKRVKRGECLAVLCLDLDHFKSINDALGHAIGDQLLKLAAERLRGATREPDTVARMGGDEFAIVMTQMQQPTDAAQLAKRIRESLVRPFHIEGHTIIIDVSIGISVAPFDAAETDALMRNADMALYGAKGDGRGVYRFFEPEMNTRMKARRELEMDLRKALVGKEFELHYQPLVNLESNEVNAFEALLRWNHPRRGLISPADFIPVAEETGLIVPLGEWVLKAACYEAVEWPDGIKVAVNLSPTQLNNRNLLSVVSGALAETGMPAHKLQLEITETVLLHNTFATLQTLHELRKLGVQIALDDFGTGYSSLSYLRSFPFDKIKIDRSFIQDLGKGSEPLAIVHAVANLAKSLNMTSTAEGVETAQQKDMLQSLGCTEMQGYLFSKARPAADIRQFFKSGVPKAVDAAE